MEFRMAARPARSSKIPAPSRGGAATIRTSSAVLCVLLAFAAGLFCGWLAARLPAAATKDPAVAEESLAGTGEPHIAQIELLTRQQPDNPTVWIHLGDAYYDAQQPARAITAYERGLALNPDNPDARTDLGTAYRLTGRYDQAIAQYDKVLAQNPRHENARLNKGVVLYYDLNRKQEALDVWKALLRIAPDAKTQDGTPLKEFLARLAAS
jgi:tetratricopeptide (TPR) repeat protein